MGASGPHHGHAAGGHRDDAPGDHSVRRIGSDGRVRSRGENARLYVHDFRRVECERAEPDFRDDCAIARNQAWLWTLRRAAGRPQNGENETCPPSGGAFALLWSHSPL